MTLLTTAHIRHATRSDAKAISALIQRVVHYFLIHPNGRGAEDFMASISPHAIADYLSQPDFRYLVTTITTDTGAEQVIGVAALRDQAHLYHLFVDPEWHRQGVAKRLWEALKAQAQQDQRYQGHFTVNSSVYAVPVYQALGFEVVSDVQHNNGIAFVSMRLCPAC
jgi:GNAT superfamily N-acetyltransferase